MGDGVHGTVFGRRQLSTIELVEDSPPRETGIEVLFVKPAGRIFQGFHVPSSHVPTFEPDEKSKSFKWVALGWFSNTNTRK